MRSHARLAARSLCEHLESRLLLSAPDSLVGDLYRATIQSATGEFTPNGQFLMAFSRTGQRYLQLGVTGAAVGEVSAGSHSYTRQNGTQALLTLNDTVEDYTARITLTFTADGIGTFSVADPGGTSSGTFIREPQDAAPATSANLQLQITGVGGFDEDGWYGSDYRGTFTTDSANRFVDDDLATLVSPDGSGSYTYTKTGPSTARLVTYETGETDHIELWFLPGARGYGVSFDPAFTWADLSSFTYAPVVGNQPPRGSVDFADSWRIAGWAQDPDAPTAPATVHIELNGNHLATLTANTARADLQTALGSANHAFRWTLPPLMQGTYTARVFALDASSGARTQIGSDRTITINASFFNDDEYLQRNPDIRAAIEAGLNMTPWSHFWNYGQKENRTFSPLFEEAFYRTRNADIVPFINNGTLKSGFHHFWLYGQREGRQATPFFQESAYLQANSDVAAAKSANSFRSGFEHFALYGLREGRQAVSWFDQPVYTAQNPDVVAALPSSTLGSLYRHFVLYGCHESRRFSNAFAESAYLANNPDVAAAVQSNAFANGFAHWVRYGRYENRKAI